jgi:hypothetical protein
MFHVKHFGTIPNDAFRARGPKRHRMSCRPSWHGRQEMIDDRENGEERDADPEAPADQFFLGRSGSATTLLSSARRSGFDMVNTLSF